MHRAISSQLLTVINREDRPRWMQYADLGACMSYIAQAWEEGRANVIAGYLVMYELGIPWYHDEKYLFEMLVMKMPSNFVHGPVIYKHNDIAVAIEWFEREAKAQGCVAIAVGDSTQGAMISVYQKLGYHLAATQLMKEL